MIERCDPDQSERRRRGKGGKERRKQSGVTASKGVETVREGEARWKGEGMRQNKQALFLTEPKGSSLDNANITTSPT